jgi:hypothetical protein
LPAVVGVVLDGTEPVPPVLVAAAVTAARKASEVRRVKKSRR